MSYNILIIAFIVLSLITPFICVWTFILGYNIGATESGKAKISTPKTPRKRRKEKEANKEFEEVKKTLEAIDDYGGNYGQ